MSEDMMRGPDLRGMVAEGREIDWLRMELDEMRQRAEWAEQSAHTRWQQLERQAEHIKGLELSRDEWKALALKYGTMTDTEKRKEIGALHGKVMVSCDVIYYAPASAIHYACADLAKKMTREFTKKQDGAA